MEKQLLSLAFDTAANPDNGPPQNTLRSEKSKSHSQRND